MVLCLHWMPQFESFQLALQFLNESSVWLPSLQTCTNWGKSQLSHKCQTNQKKQSKIIEKLYGVVRLLRPIKWNITNWMPLDTVFVWRSRNGNELEHWCFMIKGKLAHEIRLGQPCDFKMWDGLRRVSSTVKPDVGFYTDSQTCIPLSRFHWLLAVHKRRADCLGSGEVGLNWRHLSAGTNSKWPVACWTLCFC